MSQGEQAKEGELRRQRGGVKGSKGGEGHFRLGFRFPTTCDKKKFDDNR